MTIKSHSNVLLVDDDGDLLHANQLLLRHHVPGVEVRTAASADEAIAIASVWPPDVAITDVGLGDARDGFDVGLALFGLGVRYAIASGHVDEARRRRAAAVGATEIVQKPYDVRELVRRLLTGSAPASEG
jgi:DNA-binding response OmpR family regulator